jgi:hypothetical protein
MIGIFSCNDGFRRFRLFFGFFFRFFFRFFFLRRIIRVTFTFWFTMLWVRMSHSEGYLQPICLEWKILLPAPLHQVQVEQDFLRNVSRLQSLAFLEHSVVSPPRFGLPLNFPLAMLLQVRMSIKGNQRCELCACLA